MAAVVLKVALATILYDTLGFPSNQDPRCTIISHSVLECRPSDIIEVIIRGRAPLLLVPERSDDTLVITSDRKIQAVSDKKIEVNLTDASKLGASSAFDYNVKMDYTFLRHKHPPINYTSMDKKPIHVSGVDFPDNCSSNVIVSPDEPDTQYPNLVWVVCKHFTEDYDIPVEMRVYMGNTSSDTIEWTLFHIEHATPFSYRPVDGLSSFHIGKIDAIKQYLVIRYDHVMNEGFLITNVMVCKQSSTCSNSYDEDCCKRFRREPAAGKHTFVDKLNDLSNIGALEYSLTNMKQTFIPNNHIDELHGFFEQEKYSAILNYVAGLRSIDSLYMPSYYTHSAYDTGIVVLHCYLEKVLRAPYHLLNGEVTYKDTMFWFTKDAFDKTFSQKDNYNDEYIVGSPGVCHLVRFHWDDLFNASTSADPEPYVDLEFMMQLPQDWTSLDDHFNRVTQYSVSCADKTPGKCDELLVFGSSSDTESAFHVYFTLDEEGPVQMSKYGVQLKYDGMRINDINYKFKDFTGDFTHRGTFYANEDDQDPWGGTSRLIWVRVSKLNSATSGGLTTWCAYKFDMAEIHFYETGQIECTSIDYFVNFNRDLLGDSYLTKFYIGHDDYFDCTFGLCSDTAPAATLNGIYSTVIRWFDGRKEFRTYVTDSEYVPSIDPMQTIPGKHSGIAFENDDAVISETAVEVHHVSLKNATYFDAPVTMYKYGSTGTPSFPDTSVKVTLIGGQNETRLHAVLRNNNSFSAIIAAPGYRVCMGHDFVEDDSPVKTLVSGTTAVYALVDESSTSYRLDYWFITETQVINETKFIIDKNQLLYDTYDLQLVCNQGQAATKWRVGYFPKNINQNDYLYYVTLPPVAAPFNTWLEAISHNFGTFSYFMSTLSEISEVQMASHASRSGVLHEYFASLGTLPNGTTEFCANVMLDNDVQYPLSLMCRPFWEYDNCTSLTMEDTSQYLGSDVSNAFSELSDTDFYAFGKRDIFAMFMCKSSADYEPAYFYYDFSANHITRFADGESHGDSFFEVCSSNNETAQCVDSIGFHTNVHEQGFDVLFFVGQTMYFFDVVVERGTATFPVSTFYSSLEIKFPFQTSTAVYFEGWKNFALKNADFSDPTVLDMLPNWVDPASAFANTSRVAVSSDIQEFRVWGVCQNTGECVNSSAGDYVEFEPFARGPSLDNPNIIEFYLYEYGLPGSLTLLISSHTNETNIFSLVDPDETGRNVQWQFGCGSQESKDAVPFFTSDNVSACSGSSEVISRFDSTAVIQLKKFRLDQEIDPNAMYCFSAERVTLGFPCGQHPIIHSSTTDCGADGDDGAYTCVADDEIFAFENVTRIITSKCISMSGNCFDPIAYQNPIPTHANLSLEECANLCVNNTLCLGFENGNNECELFLSVQLDDSFKGQSCASGKLGFLCRKRRHGDVFSTEVVIDPGGDPDFYTNITLGNESYQQIVHGFNPSTMTMDQSGHETHFIATFESSFTITGGKIVYSCGQASDEGSVLFSQPASEDDPMELEPVQLCYLSNENFTSPHDEKLVPSNEYTSFVDKSESVKYYGHSFDSDNNEYYYTNLAESVGTIKFSAPKIPAFKKAFPAVINLEKWENNQPIFLNYPLQFAPTPGKTLESVLSTEGSSRAYGENQGLHNSYWNTYSVVPLGVDINDIRPVTVESLEGATSGGETGSKGSYTMDFDKNFAMYKTENGTGLVSDVLWGRFMNYKAYFAQTNKYDVANETDFIKRYIFSMTEAVTFDLCPDNLSPDDPNYGKDCVMNRMTRPVMNPLFSDVVKIGNNRLALGFTPYRVAPFMGVYLDYNPDDEESQATAQENTIGNRRRRSTNNDDEMMLMPDDAFIKEHGGIGFGAASTTPGDNTGTDDKVFSFGGLDYSPNSEYRPFEKLPFDMPDPLQWHPVWARKSQTFGCKEEAFDCTYSDDFYDNVVPQTELGTARNKFTSRAHVTAWAHSPDEFYHFYTPRYFQTPSYRNSHKCGPGDVTINMDLLADVSSNSPVPITESNGCVAEVKINLPFTKDQKNVDFSRATDLSPSQFNVFKIFMSPKKVENGALIHALTWMQNRKLPYYNQLWSSLLSLNYFNTSDYRRTTEDFGRFSQECVSRRGVLMKEHYSTAGSGKYHTCHPLNSGTTLMAIHDMEGDSDCPSPCPDSLSNDCVFNSIPKDFTSRYRQKSQGNEHDTYLKTDFDLYNPNALVQDEYFWTDSYGGRGKAALFKLKYMESDIGFLARECLLGHLALIKYIAHFDHEGTTFSKDFTVYTDTHQPNGPGGPYNLSKVYSPTFFEPQFEAFHPTEYLGHNNDHLTKFCKERPYGSVDGDVRRLTWAGAGDASPTINTLKETWKTKQSKFKFPSKFITGTDATELPTEDILAPTCPEEMCIGPYPALLPPFKMNCDFVDIDNRPGGQTNWRTCPMMPNGDFYAERGTREDEDGEVPFFARQIWRPPAFWHNKEGVWSSKAYRYDAAFPLFPTKPILTLRRYDMDTWDKNPQPISKVFKSTINGKSATTEVLGNLQCNRTGAVAQQSIVNPNLYYVCGGINVNDIHSLGCTMCEAFDVSLGKGATIETDFTDSTCRGFIVGLRIKQTQESENASLADFGWVQVQYACNETLVPRNVPLPDDVSETDFYREIPDIMRTIHSIKTSPLALTDSREFSFVQVALRDDHGTLRSYPLNAARIPKDVGTFIDTYNDPVFCFEPGDAEALFTIKTRDSDTSTIFLQVEGLKVTAYTNQERKTIHIQPDGFVCADVNGVSQERPEGMRQFTFWNPIKTSNNKRLFWSIEFMAINQSRFAVHTLDQRALLEGKNMTDLFGNIRWKTKNDGFHYVNGPAPDVKWGCIKNEGPAHCSSNNTCTNTSQRCLVEFYDDVPKERLQEVETNIDNNHNSQFGYLTPQESLHTFSHRKFSSFPGSFTIQRDVFGERDCDALRRNLTYNKTAMILLDTQVLERIGRPHFTEVAPTIIIKTQEACSDNSTACHTFVKDNSDPPIKICRHFVGCTKTEYVNVTEFDVNEPQYVCTGFEKCQQNVNSRYTDIGPHAGYRPSCEFVRACAEPGFYRQHEPFDLDLGQVRLGTCNPQSKCSSTSFSVGESTAVQNSQCMQFKECTDEEYEATPGTGDKDRECIKTTVCEDTPGRTTLQGATATSDAVCFDIVTECPFVNQYFDNGEGGCKDATVCGSRQEIKNEKTETTDRECVDLQECSFYEVEVPGKGVQTECRPTEHADHATEVAMMSVAGSVGFIACLLRVFFST